MSKIDPQKAEELVNLFRKDRMKFIRLYPFYGMLLMDLDAIVTENESLPIAAVSYKYLFINGLESDQSAKRKLTPYSSLSEVARRTVLAHEILHVALDHLHTPPDFDANLVNIAQDAVIHRILLSHEDLHIVNVKELPPGVVMPVKHSYSSEYTGFTIGTGKDLESFTISDFAKKDWIPIYWDMQKHLEEEAKKNGKGLSKEQIASAIKRRAEELAGKNPLAGDVEKDQEDGSNTPEKEQLRIKWRYKVLGALEQQKKQGTMPAGLEGLRLDLVDPKVHWTTYLRRLLKTETTRDDFKFKANSRKSHLTFGGRARPPIFPTIESEALGDVFLVLDTSGSMSHEELSQGLSEFRAIRQCTPFKLYFFSCDAAAYDVTIFDRHEEPDWDQMKIVGGGGTDFRPAFQLIEDFRKDQGARPALLVFFTDTMGTFPENEPDYPVIWVTNFSKGKVPWGQFVSTVN